MNWAAQEMAGVALGDQRLNRRSARLLETMATHPDASIPARSTDLAESMAAYRFLANERFDEQQILSPHIEKTIARMSSEPVVLCVEDTTQLDYSEQTQTTGLGPLYKEFRRGLFLHPILAVTPEGGCLGVLSAKFHAREDLRPKMSSGEKAKRAIEDKESYRWLDGYRCMNALAQTMSAVLIYVADREGDMEAILAEAEGQRGKVLIRARHDRVLEDDERMWDTVMQGPMLGTQEFTMAARPGIRARTVHQTLRAQTIILPETRLRIHPIHVTVIIANEDHPPEGQKAVSWTLVTTMPATTLAEAAKMVDYYRRRWVIEEYFKVLKTGCAVEKLQLETAEGLKKAIALYMIVAYRILFMVKASRETPDLSCNVIFDDQEWKIIYMVGTKKTPPATPPRLRDIVRMAAKLGGYLGRKGDGLPGAKTLWIGLGKIRSYIEVSAVLGEPVK